MAQPAKILQDEKKRRYWSRRIRKKWNGRTDISRNTLHNKEIQYARFEFIDQGLAVEIQMEDLSRVLDGITPRDLGNKITFTIDPEKQLVEDRPTRMVVKPISPKPRFTRGYVRVTDAKLNPTGGRPFFRARLGKEEIRDLIAHFEHCATEERTWYSLAAIEPDLTRLTITRSRTPQYEARASSTYARGDVFRVSGGNQSCNIDFSGGSGAQLLASRLEAAASRTRHFVELRVPSRNRHLIEFIPDTELESRSGSEDDRLGIAGEQLTGDVWDVNEFADWETLDAASTPR